MYGAGEFGDPFQLEAANTLSGIAMGQGDVVIATIVQTPTLLVSLALVAEGPEGLVQRPVHHLRRAPGLVGIFDRLFFACLTRLDFLDCGVI